ncbi:MAG: signal peptide peptidase SppA [Verrucomicrobiota bacterium]
MSQNRSGCFTAILVVTLLVSAVLNVAFLLPRATRSVKAGGRGAKSQGSPFGEQVVKPATHGHEDSENRVAVIYIRGVISSATPGQVEESGLEDTLAEIEQARTDETIKSVLLRIDSPGGEVTASDILYKAVCKLRDKKPVVVSMDSVAASGGYYVACGGSHLFAHETTITASIGVIMQTLNYRELLGKVGVDVLTFKSGAMKDLLNGARELTEEERAYVQGMINQSYDRFVGIVAKERHLNEATLRSGIADGRIVSGEDAVRAKLVDDLGGFDEALEKARMLGNVPGGAAIRYTAPLAFGRLIRMLSETSFKNAKVEVDLGGKLQGKLQNGRLYYLPAVLVP